MNRKTLILLLAVVGAALFFRAADAEARGRLFGRRHGGGGGGGGTLSINPNALPASYAPQATALQQGQVCTGANCPRPALVAAGGTAVATTVVASPAPAAAVAVHQPPATTSAGPTTANPVAAGDSQRAAALAAQLSDELQQLSLTAELERLRASAAVAAVSPAAVPSDLSAEQMGAAIGRGLSKALGLKLPQGAPEKGSLAEVVDAAPKFRGTLIGPNGVIIQELEIDFAETIRDSMGASR